MSKIVRVTDENYDEDYNILDIMDIIEDYSDNLDNLDTSEDFVKKMAEAIVYEPERRKRSFAFNIEMIFASIIAMNYTDEFCKDESYIFRMIGHIGYPKNDFDIIYNKDFYDMENLCKEVYNNMRNMYGDRIPEDMPEEFKFERIIDTKYQLDKMYSINKDRDELKHVFDSELWRCC